MPHPRIGLLPQDPDDGIVVPHTRGPLPDVVLFLFAGRGHTQGGQLPGNGPRRQRFPALVPVDIPLEDQPNDLGLVLDDLKRLQAAVPVV